MQKTSSSDPAISLSGVNLSLGRGAARVHILKDIDLHIGRGEAIGLVGPSGSGKSTLLMVMAGLERADAGTIAVAGQDLRQLDEDALARFRGRNVGIVFQSFHLIPTMTATGECRGPARAGGRRRRATRAAETELGLVGLSDRLSHYPAQLSGGEQQRVALARALAPNPSILVADEPTGNLDENTGRQVIDLLFAGHVERGTTLVLVTHDPALAARCDRVVRLRSGRVDGGVAARGRARMSVAASADHAATSGRLLPLRFALRELRGGLRGFYVLIACIGLGVMAIAGVGSFSESLGGGLAREGRTILGGDVAFSLVPPRGHTAGTRLAHAPRPRLRCRHHARDGARRASAARWSRSRRWMAPIRFTARSCSNPPCRSPTRSQTRDGVFGAAVDVGAADAARPEGRRPHQRRPGADRDSRRAASTSRTSSPAASASARA